MGDCFWGISVGLKFFFVMFLVIFLSVTVCAIDDITLSYEGEGTQYFNVTIYYSQIVGFNFDISGQEYMSSYPSNITLDFGNDSVYEWSYNPYNSTVLENASSIESAWSTNPNSGQIDFMSESINGLYLARITNNLFIKSGSSHEGNIVIGSADSINSQILAVATEDSVFHAFLPSVSPLGGGYVGLYLTEGGSTYFCNSDHTFNGVECNLSLTEALTAQHLARSPDSVNFSWIEPVNAPTIDDALNSKLLSCGAPCNITIGVKSATAGNITFSDFEVIGPEPYANVSIIFENSTHYQINISPETNLTGVEYAFGEMPEVNIIPIVGNDDNPFLTAAQLERYNVLIDNLSAAWDNLTNYSHPLNFTFYQNPEVLYDYAMSQNDFTMFYYYSSQLADSIGSSTVPKINVMLDIHDYFPDQNAYNLRSPATDDNVIGEIYLNGFSDSNAKTSQYFYYNEILLNTLLHELAHTFVFYPQQTNDSLFYSDHPASFTDILDFETYNATESPTGNEGYYEVYSILNQLRVYIGKANIGDAGPLLSPLDKMLLGILSYHELYNYTFYEGNIAWNSDRYEASGIAPASYNDTHDLYVVANRDVLFWDVREDSTKIDMGTNTTFLVPKENQNGSALWVFAKDLGHTDYFKVFNNNACSGNQVVANSVFSVNLISPEDDSSSYDNVTLYCSAYGNVSNVTLYTNVSGWGAVESNVSGGVINYTLSNVDVGTYLWNCLAYDDEGNSTFSTSNYTFNIFHDYSPDAVLFEPEDGFHTSLTDIDFTCNLSDDIQLLNVTLYGNWSGGWHANESSLVSGISNSTTFSKSLDEGSYSWNCLVCDNGSNCDFASVNSSFFVGDLIISFNESEWDMDVTTNFSNLSTDELGDLSGARFENSFGSINFSEDVSILRSLDLGYSVVISDNFVFVDSSALPEFDVSANVSLYGLSFVDPYVLRDGVNCTDCVELGYNFSSGILIFSVSGFSNYSAEEMPEESCSDGVLNQDETGVDCGGVCDACSSGGGGGSSSSTVDDVVLNESVENGSITLENDVVLDDVILDDIVEEDEVVIDEVGSWAGWVWLGGFVVLIVGILGWWVWRESGKVEENSPPENKFN